jgi:hypothetical protein
MVGAPGIVSSGTENEVAPVAAGDGPAIVPPTVPARAGVLMTMTATGPNDTTAAPRIIEHRANRLVRHETRSRATPEPGLCTSLIIGFG